MELRVLQNFLIIAKEGSITNAAAKLNVSQPTLSRQIQDLERDLGCRLFVRSSHCVRLTREGMMLRKRAQEIASLVDKTEREMNYLEDTIYTDIYIGTEETACLDRISKAAARLQKEHPGVRFHFVGGTRDEVIEQLDSGLVDFGLVFEGDHNTEEKIDRFHNISMQYQDQWGVIMQKTDPLAKKKTVKAQDLKNSPLILSRQNARSPKLKSWFGSDYDRIHVSGTYSQTLNASFMVKDGLGKAICKKDLLKDTGYQDLCFRPMSPAVQSESSLIWKKYERMSGMPEKFLEYVQQEVESSLH